MVGDAMQREDEVAEEDWELQWGSEGSYLGINPIQAHTIDLRDSDREDL